MSQSYRIVFYVSGHGFGHASRTIGLIRALRRSRPDVGIAVRTSAPRRLFDRAFAGQDDVPGASQGLEFFELQCDTGMVQLDSLRVDDAASIRLARAFHEGLDGKAAAEAACLRSSGAGLPDLIVGDIPPLAFAAAAKAGVRSVAVGNFTWDWIYEGYPEQSPEALVETLRGAYRHAALALRLPMAAGFAGLEGVTRDIPFIARHAQRDAADVRRWLGIPAGPAMLLMSFGHYGVANLDTAALAAMRDYAIVTTDFPASGNGIRPAPGVICVSEQRLYDEGYRYEDLVGASDAVVTKPGYGIISECVANDTAILYTSRGRFPEYDVLVREMPKHLRAQFIGQEDLLAGRWAPALERLLSSPKPAVRPATNGAEVAAEAILSLEP